MKAILPLLFLGVAGGAALAGAASDLPAFKVERWVNSPPLTAEALRGKVVLVDFWEYTCINWIRTSPYVKAWHRDYAALGLVVIGVHAPEFEFGKRAEQHRPRDSRPWAHLPDRARQRLCDLAGPRQRRLAGEVPLRRARKAGEAVGRRGQLRRNRGGDPASAGGGDARHHSCRRSAPRRRRSPRPASPPTPGSPARPTSAPTGASRARSPWKAIGAAAASTSSSRRAPARSSFPSPPAR